VKNSIFFMIWAAILFNTAVLNAQSIEDDTSKPLHITSDTMISDQTLAYVEFTGNVKATREDDVIHADSMKIYLKNSDDSTRQENSTSRKEGEKQTVEKIVASGHVEYISGDRKAFSDMAVYTTNDQVLILTGASPKVITGDSYVTGKKITLYRATNKVIVVSGKEQRVEALFNPKDRKE